MSTKDKWTEQTNQSLAIEIQPFAFCTSSMAIVSSPTRLRGESGTRCSRFASSLQEATKSYILFLHMQNIRGNHGDNVSWKYGISTTLTLRKSPKIGQDEAHPPVSMTNMVSAKTPPDCHDNRKVTKGTSCHETCISLKQKLPNKRAHWAQLTKSRTEEHDICSNYTVQHAGV